MMNVRCIVDYNKCEECNRKANTKTAYGQLMCYECFVYFQNEQEVQDNDEEQNRTL